MKEVIETNIFFTFLWFPNDFDLIIQTAMILVSIEIHFSHFSITKPSKDIMPSNQRHRNAFWHVFLSLIFQHFSEFIHRWLKCWWKASFNQQKKNLISCNFFECAILFVPESWNLLLKREWLIRDCEAQWMLRPGLVSIILSFNDHCVRNFIFWWFFFTWRIQLQVLRKWININI